LALGVVPCRQPRGRSRSERSVYADQPPYSKLCEKQPDQIHLRQLHDLGQCVKGQASLATALRTTSVRTGPVCGGAATQMNRGMHLRKCQHVRVAPTTPQRFFSCKDGCFRPPRTTSARCLRSGWLQKSFVCTTGMMYKHKKDACEAPCCTIVASRKADTLNLLTSKLLLNAT
ncbi:uncharacterized protein LOC134787401, partial [Penaeus indicus]|uniref:uncharacterized protein LOC134787401 n=1 Tax=Penaeus indicus TaxID=29960 RepID=UPI00300C404F